MWRHLAEYHFLKKSILFWLPNSVIPDSYTNKLRAEAVVVVVVVVVVYIRKIQFY